MLLGAVIVAIATPLQGHAAAAPSIAPVYESGKDCLFVADDVFGYKFSYYCTDSGRFGAVAVGGNKYVNSDLVDAKDCFIWGDQPGALADFSPGSRKSMCFAGKMKSLMDLNQGKIGGLWAPGKDRLDAKSMYEQPGFPNSCSTLPGNLKAQCQSPAGQNPCLVIGTPPFAGERSSQMRDECQKSHPDFLMSRVDQLMRACQGLAGISKYDCEAKARQADHYELSENKELNTQLEEILGYGVLFVGGGCLVGVFLSCGGMAIAWYTGHPFPWHFARLGWVFVATGSAGSATVIAHFFIL